MSLIYPYLYFYNPYLYFYIAYKVLVPWIKEKQTKKKKHFSVSTPLNSITLGNSKYHSKSQASLHHFTPMKCTPTPLILAM